MASGEGKSGAATTSAAVASARPASPARSQQQLRKVLSAATCSEAALVGAPSAVDLACAVDPSSAKLSAAISPVALERPDWSPSPAVTSWVGAGAGSLWAAVRAPNGCVYAGGRSALVRWTPPGAAPGAPEDPGCQLATVHQGSEGTYALTLSSCGSLLHAGCGDGVVRTFEAATGRLLATRSALGAEEEEDADAEEGQRGCYALAASSDGRLLLCGHGDGAVRAWRTDAAPQEPPWCVWHDVHAGAVTALALVEQPGGVALLLSGGEDGALCCTRFQPAASGDAAAQVVPAWRASGAHGMGVTALSVDAPRQRLFSASWQGRVTCHCVCTGAPDAGFPEGGAWVHPGADTGATALALCPRARALYVGCADGRLRLLCPRSGDLLGTLYGAGTVNAVTTLALLDDGETLLAAGCDRVLRCWTVAPPAAWHPAASHARFPQPFKAALRALALGTRDPGCLLGRALGGLDGCTRAGMLESVAGLLARELYGA